MYSKMYKGWYCVPDETFLTDSQLKEGGVSADGQRIYVSAESGHPVEWTEERNYMFRLSGLQKDLERWISANG